MSLLNSQPYQNCMTWKFTRRYRFLIVRKLKTMVKRSIDQNLRFRNLDARFERIDTGEVVTNRRGQRGIERGQGVCYQWTAKGQCLSRDQCSFWHDEDNRAKPTPKTAPLQNHQHTEVEVRRGKVASEAGVHLGSSVDSGYRDFLKSICTKSPCD